MEPVKGGNLANLPEDAKRVLDALHGGNSASYALRYAAGFDGIVMVISGMSDMTQMMENISFMKDFCPLNKEELSAIEQVHDIFKSKNMISCTACQYCVDGCPKQVNIPAYFSVYNSFKLYGTRNFPGMHYARQSHGRGKASECIECRLCESHCPQHIEITEKLKLVAEAFE
jgi:predicted aldo/keto reductase-like oxidoreductase